MAVVRPQTVGGRRGRTSEKETLLFYPGTRRSEIRVSRHRGDLRRPTKTHESDDETNSKRPTVDRPEEVQRTDDGGKRVDKPGTPVPLLVLSG